MSNSKYFQDHMPGNVCFGCGQNHDGLKIKSYWDGDEAVCHWESQEKYHGWKNLMNGGIMATLIDCHCMCTAMADAYRNEDRKLDSQPEYRYATGSMSIRYIKPTPNDTVELRAKVTETKGRKTKVNCDFISSKGEVSATAEVIAIRVFDGNTDSEHNPFNS